VALLAYLALHPNEVIPFERLVDGLWKRPPKTARKALQVHMFQLRTMLAGDASESTALLQTDRAGYRLAVEPERIDVNRFQSFAEEARSALRAGDHATAAAGCREALVLWRGPALAEFTREPFAAPAAARLEEDRLAMIETRIEAELALHRHEYVLPELEELTARHPLREGLRAQLMLALYRAGRQSEALDVFRRTRATLVDARGLEPGPVLRDLQRAILRQDPALDPPSAPPTTLPVAGGDLIGRERELAELRDLLGRREVRLLTLTGPGGAGKTRLALEVAWRVRLAFPDGVHFVELAQIAEEDQLVQALARRLGIKERRGKPLAEAVSEALRDKRILLVLDSFERLLPGEHTVAAILSTGAEAKIVVTSRIPLHLSAEFEYPVRPLPVPAENEVDTGRLAGYASVQLFLERARAVNPGFTLHAEDAAALTSICRRLDGLPLALELAAAHMKALSAQELSRRLERPLEVLRGGARDRPNRHRALEAAISWSYDMLSPEERDAFEAIAVFEGTFTLAAAEAVIVRPRSRALPLLESLVNKSLLDRRSEPGRDGRYLMLDTIHELARERLRRTGRERDRRERHLRFYVELLAAAEPEIADGRYAEWNSFFDAEYPNLLAALTFALEIDPDAALRIALVSRFFWYFHGHFAEGRRILESALAGASDLPAERRVRALNGLGVLAGEQRDLAAAQRFLSESYETAQAHGWRVEAARSLTNLGLLAHYEGDLARSQDLLERAVALQDELGNVRGKGIALKNLGGLLSRRGELDRASEILETSLECARASDDAHEISTALRALARTLTLRGHATRARELVEESLEQGSRHGILYELVESLEVWAGMLAKEGDLETSAILFGAAEVERETTGPSPSPPQESWCTEWRSFLRQRLGDRELEMALHRGRLTPAAVAIELARSKATGSSEPIRNSPPVALT
jgi:predicted ATPase/DNA-binding SARP family transcriptional activator